MSASLELIFEPDFVENAVFLAIRQYEEDSPVDLVAEWHAERNRIYTIKDGQIRDKAFNRLEAQWFTRLGLRSRFEAVLQSFPILRDYSLMIRIRRALAGKDEGSELYVQGDRKTNLVKLQTMRLFEEDLLERFLRHEWLRVSDMLDPIFQYSPHTALSGSSELEDNLIRDRYRILWDLYLGIRLLKRGFDILIPLARQKKFIDRAFSTWTAAARQKMFEEILHQKYRTQLDFLNLAHNDKLTLPLGRGGLLCPLCHFTSFDPLPISRERDRAIIDEIQTDYPDWELDMGLCRNCFDLYRSRLRVGA